MAQKWDPWNIKATAPALNITEPPCKDCRFWNPYAVFETNKKTGQVAQNGIRCCTAEDMFRDFSCYEPREN